MYRRTGTYIFAAMTLAACANDVDNGVGGDGRADGGSIAFVPGVMPVTRANKTGQEAAAALGGKFYVYAIKNEDAVGAGKLTNDNLVFKNYKVEYEAGSENTSTSNTTGWEYVGKSLTDVEAERITDNIGTGVQTIKYWDTNATDYSFYAFAVNGTDVTDGHLSVAKTTDKTDSHLNGYTMTVDASADPTKIYIASRKHLTAENYNGNVTFDFCGAMAKVRVAMYETISGYSVKLKAFRIADDKTVPAFGEMNTETTGNFAANLVSNKPGEAGVMTVTYMSGRLGEENTPRVTFAPTGNVNYVLALGNNLKADKELTTTAADAVYDQTDGAYTTVYPMADNANNLKLKVDFTLESAIGETIEVTNATAEVPATYLKWKPNCAYTYIFKISDQTNATIGSLTGLHPITFDAVAIADGTGREEVISTTGNDVPNIVTMGYNTATDSITVGADDYNEGNTLYATYVNGDEVVAPSAANTKLYVVTTTDEGSYPVTESTVEDYLNAYAADNGLMDQPVTVYEQTLTADNFVATVPMGNGSSDTRTIDAVKWTAGHNVYAVAYNYTQTDGTTATLYKIVGVDGYKGKTTGALALSLTEVTNAGASIVPRLTVDGATLSNSEVSYALDYAGTYGTAVPTTVTMTGSGTDDVAINVPAGTTPTSGTGRYTVIATCNRRTYKASFTVNQ